MARPKNSVPTYSKHPIHNSARCWVGGRWLNLGPWDSPESRAEFARVCARLAAGGPPPDRAPGAVTCGELILRFKAHAESFYVRPDGTRTSEVEEFKAALRVVRELYGHAPAREFGPVALQAVRAAMVKLGWCRSRVNNQVRRVRRAWKWAAAQEIVPGALVADLAAVVGLRRNRCGARETDPVLPVPDDHYRATLPFLVPTVRAMCELQRAGGLRPGEVRALVPADLDRSGELWVYRPAEHKMAYLGRDKAIPLSPSARAVVEPWLAGRGPDEPLFTPTRARAERHEMMRAARKSKVQPSQADRKKPEAEKTRQVPAMFSKYGYRSAVVRAAKRAGVPHWFPNQIRHAFGTEVRERFGLEVAQVLLGHTHAKTTEIYAEAALRAATEAARKLG